MVLARHTKMSLEEEIISLTAKWYKYVGMDHHKDRDCHWYITKTYSYGQEPYYEAHHNGYVIDHWTSPKCGTEELAETILRDKLRNELNTAIISLKDVLSNQDALDWFNQTEEEVKNLIKELE